MQFFYKYFLSISNWYKNQLEKNDTGPSEGLHIQRCYQNNGTIMYLSKVLLLLILWSHYVFTLMHYTMTVVQLTPTLCHFHIQIYIFLIIIHRVYTKNSVAHSTLSTARRFQATWNKKIHANELQLWHLNHVTKFHMHQILSPTAYLPVCSSIPIILMIKYIFQITK